jgi:hypothetical protein
MRQILHNVARLDSSEVDFIMDFSMMQRRSSFSIVDSRLKHPPMERERGRQLIESLYAIAGADGHIGVEEELEIQSIAAEFRLDVNVEE